jgi:hypothetical protein
MTRDLNRGGSIPAANLKAIMAGMSNLLTTEADRRRLRLELMRASIREAGADDPAVAKLADYRRKLSKGSS